MLLDVRTSMFLISTGSLAISTAMVALSGRYTGHIGRAISYWGNGLAMVGVCFVLISLRGTIPDLFSIVAANSLGIWGLFLRYFAVKTIKRQAFGIGLPILATLLATVFNLVFVYGDDNFAIRSSVNVAMDGVIVLLTSIPLFLGVDKAKRASYWFSGAILLITGLIFMARALAVPFFGESIPGIFSPSVFQNLILLSSFLGTVISSILFTFIAIDEYNFDLFDLATRDPLTNLFNRRMFYALAEKEVSRFLRDGIPLSVIVFDLDHFKSVNDRHGHAGGDLVLQKVASSVASIVRSEDVFARLGGEEFCVLLPSVRQQNALVMAEKFRHRLENIALKIGEETVTITASFGVATMDSPGIDFDALLRQADHALYAGKRKGRNCVMAN